MLTFHWTYGTLFRGHLTPTIWINVAWILLLQIIGSARSSCLVNRCSEDFVSNTKLLTEGPYFPFCVQLNTYMKCIEEQVDICRGSIYFHSTKISVETLLHNNECQRVLQQPEQDNPQPKKDDSHNEITSQGGKVVEDPCSFHGRSPLAHCGLFGDPHLKTFNNTFQTCRVRGAWPMLSSQYLAIQVTNEHVGEDLKATATTKVTVLVKGNDECGLAKTYEASIEELPKAFVDGTTYSGSDRNSPYVQVIEAISGQHVIIMVKIINSTINVRRVGKYLTVSVTAPQEIVDSMNGDMQLCDQGCPQSELLEVETSKLLTTSVMTQSKAQSLCSEYNVTDFYLDSCVFDLMTTGDVTFRDAAIFALRDMWHNDPKASFLVLKNCTNWPCLWQTTNGGSGVPILGTMVLISIFLLYL